MQNKKTSAVALYERLAGNSDLAFPAVTDAYTGAAAIGVRGVYAGRRMILGERVLTGSWRRKDGTRSYKWSRWVTFEREVCGVAMDGIALIPESEFMCVAIVRIEVAA